MQTQPPLAETREKKTLKCINVCSSRKLAPVVPHLKWVESQTLCYATWSLTKPTLPWKRNIFGPMDVLLSRCSLGAGFELTLNVIKGGFGSGRNEMRTTEEAEEEEVLISLIRLGRPGAVEATKGEDCQLCWCFWTERESAVCSVSVGHARSTTGALICQIKWGSKRGRPGRRVALGLLSLE